MTVDATPIGPHETLLHIGPHKTGTSAVQGALAAARPRLLEHGVLYPGPGRSQADAARAASGVASTTGFKLPSRRRWDDLVAQAAAAPDRVAISSEFFDIVDAERAREITTDLGADRVHVVITSSPLTSVMVSSWQQAVRSKLRMSIDEWVRFTFDREEATAPFWIRQRIDWQIERWAQAVGIDRVHLVMTDKREPRQLFGAFERLLDLPEGLLVPRPSSANRSFTLEEIELIRRVNIKLGEHGWNDATHARFVRLGAVRAIQKRRPPEDEPRITLPAWAVERANEVAHEMIAGIQASGVHVVGDPSTLVSEPPAHDDPAEVTRIDLDVAVDAIVGVMKSGGAGILREQHVDAARLKEYPGLSSAPLDLLRAELTRRARARLRRTLRR